MKLSKTPPTYRRSAPGLGQHTDEVLAEMLGLTPSELTALKEKGVI
jgi:crotonobetainyl-CoA:carnitine CoA-transferase CaiB-like acyl-CoA transferase